MKVYQSVTELIGQTPLLEFKNYERMNGISARLFGKLEFFNPAGSAKDRVADYMIAEAEKSGLLKPDSVIIEPTSGNTGIGLCSIASAKGYRVIIVMPETMSQERKNLMKAYGAELVLTDGAQGMSGSIKKAKELAEKIPNSFIPGQFVNPANPLAHYETTGPEIWEDTDGAIDIFVAGVGTGGTISGTGRYLKEKNQAVRIVAVEPENSAVLSGKAPGAHKLQGIGAGFVPDILDRSICDEIFAVSDSDAYETGRKIAKAEGILIGISAGAAVYAAQKLAERPENAGKNIVVLIPDSGEHYLTTPNYFIE